MRTPIPYSDSLASLWRNRNLLFQFAKRSVELRHRGSHLGWIWSFLQPLLLLALYFFVFGMVFGGRFGVVADETAEQYALGIFLGLTFFHFIAEVFALSPSLVVSNPNFVKKVVFPIEILPAATVIAAAFHFFISLALILVGIAWVGGGLSLHSLWLLLVVAPLLLIGLGGSWILAALGVFFRDIAQATQFLTLALMFGSAVFYSTDKIPSDAWSWLRFNPLLLAIEVARDGALWKVQPNLVHLGYVWAFGLVTFLFGLFIFQRLKGAFSDVL